MLRAFLAAHRLQPCLEASVICLDGVICVALYRVQGVRDQFVGTRRQAGRGQW